jgi:hypothetical protein
MPASVLPDVSGNRAAMRALAEPSSAATRAVDCHRLDVSP